MKKPEFNEETTVELVKTAQVAGEGEPPVFDSWWDEFQAGREAAKSVKAPEVRRRR